MEQYGQFLAVTMPPGMAKGVRVGAPGLSALIANYGTRTRTYIVAITNAAISTCS